MSVAGSRGLAGSLVLAFASTARSKLFRPPNVKHEVNRRRQIGSKETAMPTRRLARIAWTHALIAGCAAMFGVCVLTGSAQAQQSAPAASAPGPAPTPPTQSPTVNPPSPSTAQQPSYQPLSPSKPSTTPTTPNTTSSTPSTVPNTEATSPANEQPKTAAQSERHAAKPSPVHRYRRRAALVTYSCSHLGCVRTYAWAFPCQYYSRSCYPYGQSYVPLYGYAARWWPGYYDYAPGQFGRARYLGRGHRAGYWGD